ncbi:T-cell surface glycoprotein CD8 beta chain [Phodopus roborovskii]|uniref:T-cell surface glycoprotein CD8 beta chain n=1 Tax=Phodopus roborovskii TaxID=109678 RepID=UPI0021E3C91D|nr:T-cell surface glycoprotein CD8 beta chain [Phodopus roborovskii]
MQPWLWLVFSVKLAALWSSSALIQTPRSLTVLTNQMAKVSCEAKTLPKTTVISWLRQRQGPTKDKHFEFLASWNPSRRTATYGEGVKKESIMVFSDITRHILNLTSVKLEDSGSYFCMMVGSPQLIFGTGTELSVVDVLSTTAQTTKKTVFKKKLCPVPKPKAQKGLTCGLITLSLLVASLLVLLVSLSVAIRLHCLRRKAQIRFMKQFHK